MIKALDALFLSAIVFMAAGGYIAMIRYAISELKREHGESWKQHFPWSEALVFLAIAITIGWTAIESLSQRLE